MKDSIYRLGMKVCIAMLMVTASVQAVVITDNNLSTTALPDVANTNNDYAVRSFSVQGRTLYCLENQIESTVTGSNMNPYTIEGVSRLAAPTSTVDLIASLKIASSGGVAYPKVLKTLRFIPDVGVTTLYFGVGFGRFDGHKAASYRWLASEIKVHQSAMADAALIGHTHGNLVPNAGFENDAVIDPA